MHCQKKGRGPALPAILSEPTAGLFLQPEAIAPSSRLDRIPLDQRQQGFHEICDWPKGNRGIAEHVSMPGQPLVDFQVHNGFRLVNSPETRLKSRWFQCPNAKCSISL